MNRDLIKAFADLVDTATQKEISAATDLTILTELEIKYLGRKGELAAIMADMKNLTATERPAVGAVANRAKQKLTGLFAARRAELEKLALRKIVETEKIDVSEPGAHQVVGSLHLTTQAIDEIADLFSGLGFTRARYPEVDWDWYVFEALNMPVTHPARDDWETFFVDAPAHLQKGKLVLTPHTSNGQIHEMTNHKPPIRLINIAKCYRRQSDVTHTPMFHQFEGLVVDKGITLAHLKGTLQYFARHYFGRERRVRLRPHHFRFTEPSFEVDISCDLCQGTGFVAPANKHSSKCRVCKEGWLELGGAGMVHPNVFQACGIDSDSYTGFAFGWGVERTFMMRAGLKISDLRELYKNDLRFLRQF